MKPRSYWPKRVLAAYHAKRDLIFKTEDEYRVIQIVSRRYGLWCRVTGYNSGRVRFTARAGAVVPKTPVTLKGRKYAKISRGPRKKRAPVMRIRPTSEDERLFEEHKKMMAACA